MANRLIGTYINQEDDPWWVAGILGWLSMYKSLMEAYGTVGKGYREEAERVLTGKVPYRAVSRKTGSVRTVYGAHALYAVYEDYCDAMTREANK